MSVILCGRDHLLRLIGGKVRRRAESHRRDRQEKKVWIGGEVKRDESQRAIDRKRKSGMEER